MPLIVAASGSSSPSVTIVNKGQQYLVAPNGDSSYVLINGYQGTFTVKSWDYAPQLPMMIKVDGSVQSASNNTTYNTKDYVALRNFNSSGYQYGYYITFN